MCSAPTCTLRQLSEIQLKFYQDHGTAKTRFSVLKKEKCQRLCSMRIISRYIDVIPCQIINQKSNSEIINPHHQAFCFFVEADSASFLFNLALLLLMACMITLKSASSCSVHGSDLVDKSSSFGSLISPICYRLKYCEISRKAALVSMNILSPRKCVACSVCS